MFLLLTAFVLVQSSFAHAQNGQVAQTSLSQAPTLTCPGGGVRMVALTDHISPMVRFLLPGEAADSHGIQVECPESIKVGAAKEKLYTVDRRLKGNSAGSKIPPYTWQATQQSLSYTMQIEHGISIVCKVLAEADGPRFRYTFTNPSEQAYDTLQPITCVQLGTGPAFGDVRLERTWVHLAGGFDLLASESPERLTQPVKEWGQSRYHAFLKVPNGPHENRLNLASAPRGFVIMYHKSRPIDDPVIATTSVDGQWVVATYNPTARFVWSNPQWTCQHSDPSAPLPAHGRVQLEVKVFVFRGGLAALLPRLAAERARQHAIRGAIDSGK
jgi:hypothetical protein